MFPNRINNVYNQFNFGLLIVVCFLGGCGSVDVPSVYIPAAPNWSEIPAAVSLPIDGEWKNEGGVVFLIKNGKGRALNSPSLDPLSVVFKDIKKVGPGKYTLNQLSFNSKSRTSNFGLGYLELISRTELLFRLFPDPETQSKGGKLIFTNVRLDNDLFYLNELDSAGLKENWYFSESTPEYSIIFLTENEDSGLFEKKTVISDPRNLSINFHNKPCIETKTDWLVTIFAKDSSGKEVYGSNYDLKSISTQFEYLDKSCLSKTRIQSTSLQTMQPGKYIAILKIDKTLKSAVDFTILPN